MNVDKSKYVTYATSFLTYIIFKSALYLPPKYEAH